MAATPVTQRRAGDCGPGTTPRALRAALLEWGIFHLLFARLQTRNNKAGSVQTLAIKLAAECERAVTGGVWEILTSLDARSIRLEWCGKLVVKLPHTWQTGIDGHPQVGVLEYLPINRLMLLKARAPT